MTVQRSNPRMRDRIVELRRVKASELRPHPANWRTHPKAQRDVLAGVLAEIGYAGALMAYREADGGLVLCDGHLRRDLTPDQEVPVLVTDLTADEARKLLAVYDPLASMAEADSEKLAALLASVETEDAAVKAMLDGLAAQGAEPALEAATPPEEFPEYDENIETEYRCPKCGYSWSGKAAP